MRQAIVTKYHSYTNTRGSRVSAGAQVGKITLGWDNALNVEENHVAAAKAFAVKRGWTGTWVGGGLPGSGFAFVMGGTPRGDIEGRDFFSVK